MRSTKTIRRLAAVCALVLAGLVCTASPAAAVVVGYQHNISPYGPPSEFQIAVFANIYQEPNNSTQRHVLGEATFEMGAGFGTSAKICNAVMWLSLSDGVTTWDSQHWTIFSGCTEALDTRGTFSKDSADTPGFDSAAVQIKVHACAVLVWDNGSQTTYGCVVHPNWVHY